jgi:hypothetical protein
MHALQEEADRIAEARAAEEQRKALEERKRLEIRMQAVRITNTVQFLILLSLAVLAVIGIAICEVFSM